MRNMSFALTAPQILSRSKCVTRRLGWTFLKPGELFCAIEKGQGLKKGEKVRRLTLLRVKSVRREPLRRLLTDRAYGLIECILEGFADPHALSEPAEFVRFFCKTHKGCRPHSVITRIEFDYVSLSSRG